MEGLEELDRVGAEGEQHPTEGGDAGRQPEGVQLGGEHVDAEGGRRPLVGAHRDHLPTGPAAPQVGHRQGTDDEGGERHEAIALGVAGGVDVEAQHRLLSADTDAVGAGEVGAVEHHALDGEAEPEGDDREVHAARPKRGQTEQQADGDGEEDGGEGGELEGPARRRHEPSGDERPDAREGELGEGDLAGVAGEHDDRQHDDGREERDRDAHHPLARQDRPHQHRGDRDDGDHVGPPDPAGAQRRQSVEQVPTHRERRAPRGPARRRSPGTGGRCRRR